MRSWDRIGAALALALIFLSVGSAEQDMNLKLRWTVDTSAPIGDIAIADADREGGYEIYVGLLTSEVLVYDAYGNLLNQYSIGNASRIGKIYSMDVADVDGDATDELILGLGGAREVRTYDPQDFQVEGLTVQVKDTVLYRVLRNHGSVYVINPDGTQVWRQLTDDSVKAVAYVEDEVGSGQIAAGVGDLTIYTYNERTNEQMENVEVCTTELITDEESGYATEADCLDHSKCCYRLRDCICWWDDSLIDPTDPTKGTADICYRNYSTTVCEMAGSGEVIGWHLVEYKYLNGSIFLFDSDGRFSRRYEVTLKDEKGNVVAGADNTIADLFPGDLEGDGDTELLVAANSGELMALEVSNSSVVSPIWSDKSVFFIETGSGETVEKLGDQIKGVAAGDTNGNGFMEVAAGSSLGYLVSYDRDGGIRWRTRLDDSVSDIRVVDIEADGNTETIVSTKDGSIHVYDSPGRIKWSYLSDESIVGFRAKDVDKNGLVDFITFSKNLVTRLEADEFYLKKFQADAYYDTAYEKYEEGDHTTASIYLGMAREIYEEIDSRESLPRLNALDKRISDELRVRKKQEADRLYSQALSYYSLNDFTNALRKLNDARQIYEKIGDADGVANTMSLEANIKDETREVRRIEADSIYTKAITLINFGNYTGALTLLDQARKIYVEVGYLNGSVKTDVQVIKIADRHYNMAVKRFDARNYEKALAYAQTARDLYFQAGLLNMTLKAKDLVVKANESLINPPSLEEPGFDPIPYLMLAVLALGAAGAAYIVLKLLKSSKKSVKRTVEVKGTDEELEELERAEAGGELGADEKAVDGQGGDS